MTSPIEKLTSNVKIDKNVAALVGRGAVHQDVIDATKVTREVQGAAGGFDMELTGAENVTRVRERGLKTGNNVDDFTELDSAKLRQGALGIFFGVQRGWVVVLRILLALGSLGFFFEQVCAVRQQERTELSSAETRDDRAAEAVAHEAGQITRVVEVRVRQQDCIDGVSRNRERLAVAVA